MGRPVANMASKRPDLNARNLVWILMAISSNRSLHGKPRNTDVLICHRRLKSLRNDPSCASHRSLLWPCLEHMVIMTAASLSPWPFFPSTAVAPTASLHVTKQLTCCDVEQTWLTVLLATPLGSRKSPCLRLSHSSPSSAYFPGFGRGIFRRLSLR